MLQWSLLLACGLSSMSGCSSGPSALVKSVCQQALSTVNVNGKGFVFAYSGHAPTFKDYESAGGPTFATEVETWFAAKGPSASVEAAGVVRECHRLGAL